MTNKDPIVQAERMERLRKIRELAQKVQANRRRIERNIETIDRAGEDNKAAAIELESDTHMLISAATNAGLGSRKDSDTVDVLLGLLVELPAHVFGAGSAAVSVSSSLPVGVTVGSGGGGCVTPMPMSVIDNASGAALDGLGLQYRCGRKIGESDAVYRERIRSVMRPPCAD